MCGCNQSALTLLLTEAEIIYGIGGVSVFDDGLRSYFERASICASPISLLFRFQYGTAPFNKGRIMNAAFEYAQKLAVDCVIFHDVDVLPEDDRIPYGCPQLPRHLGGRVSTLEYKYALR